MKFISFALLLAVLLLSVRDNECAAASGVAVRNSVVRVLPGEDAPFELQSALINAIPGDTIELVAGTYQFKSELNVACDNLTIRGAGPEKTILSFRGQTVGSNGITSTGDAFVLEDLAIEDTAGNAVKSLGAKGIIYRRVRVEWTDGPKSTNGAYGLYPVECENVLIDGCTAIAASDAGIYVGQSQDVIVRHCMATKNVAGIEIENTLRADVYDNQAIDNTGGLLVFDLPGLNLKNGGQVRVFRNKIERNNHPNFAPKGSMVASVPAGTGVMLMATDHVEVFDNDIVEHGTSNVLVVSFLATQKKFNDPQYDPFPEAFSIHDNRMSGGGTKPEGDLGTLLRPLVGMPFPDIFFDGFQNPAKLQDGQLPEDLRPSIRNNGDARFANVHLNLLPPAAPLSLNYHIDRDLAKYDVERKPLPKVTLRPLQKSDMLGNPAVAVYRKAPKTLSEWKLLTVKNGKYVPADDVFEYDLNAPLFSDYTLKQRLVRLPQGSRIQWHQSRALEFPVGTVIAKTFSYPDESNDLTPGLRHMETRISLREPGGWYGYSYIWNDQQTDAALSLGGGEREVSWVDSNGQTRSNIYQIPNANQCLACHDQDGAFVPLGPTAANLNRNAPHSGENQLKTWLTTSKLEAAPPSSDWPTLSNYEDESLPVSHRARAWLDTNCAHCHNPEGSARTSGLDLRASQQNAAKFGVFKSPVAAGKGSGGRDYDIVPGKPDESILMFRIEIDEPAARMPNLARNITHDEGVRLIRDWIKSMPSSTSTP